MKKLIFIAALLAPAAATAADFSVTLNAAEESARKNEECLSWSPGVPLVRTAVVAEA